MIGGLNNLAEETIGYVIDVHLALGLGLLNHAHEKALVL
jgi:hypothetical protein